MLQDYKRYIVMPHKPLAEYPQHSPAMRFEGIGRWSLHRGWIDGLKAPDLFFVR